MAMAQTAKTNGQTGRKERGTGPMQLTYVDVKGVADHKRVPLDAAGVKVSAAGNSKNYDASKLPAAIKDALVTSALAARIKIYVANHAEDNGSNVIKLADHIYGEFLAGKIYSRGEGEKRGKRFDAGLYAEALRATYAFMAKKGLKKKDGKPVVAMTDLQVADVKTQLEAATPKDRSDKIKSWNGNSIYKKALAELKTKSIEVGNEVLEDMPF